MTAAVAILAVFVLTFGTAYFVAQEFGYMTVDRSRLRAGANDAVPLELSQARHHPDDTLRELVVYPRHLREDDRFLAFLGGVIEVEE